MGDAFDDLLKQALRLTPEQCGPKGPECLTLAELALLPRAEAHVTACARCARLLLDFDAPPPVGPSDQDFDIAAGWRRVLDSLA